MICFASAIATLLLIFSSGMPLILLFGSVFFFIKFQIDTYSLIFCSSLHQIHSYQGKGHRALLNQMVASISISLLALTVHMSNN